MNLEKEEAFIVGQKKYQDGHPGPGTQIAKAFKVVIGLKDWNDKYRANPAYCLFSKDKAGVLVGFLAVSTPKYGSLCTDEEQRQMDDQRRANNTYPTVLKSFSTDIGLDRF